ncbi:MAG: hypothetical protein Q9223_007091 [Gallowayella weberi]
MSDSAETPASLFNRRLQDATKALLEAKHPSCQPTSKPKKPKKSIEPDVVTTGRITNLDQIFSIWLAAYGTAPLVPGKKGFLDLPPELQNEIYSLVLVTPWTRLEPVQYRRHPKCIPPLVALLLVSKKVYCDSIYFLYSKNTFTTRYTRSEPARKFLRGIEDRSTFEEAVLNQQQQHDQGREPKSVYEYGDVGDDSENRMYYASWKVYGHYVPLHPLEHRKGPFSWNKRKDKVIGAISKIYATNVAGIPRWLLEFEGFFFPAFLRKIGPENAARIETIVVLLRPITQARKILPIYVELFTQHCKGLRKVVLEFYGANRHSHDLSLATRNYNQYVSVIDLCIWLRKAHHKLPDLETITMTGVADEVKEMGQFVLNQKPKNGYPPGFDFEEFCSFRQEWLGKFKSAMERAIAHPEAVKSTDVYLVGWPGHPYF